MTRKFGIGVVGAGMAIKPHTASLKALSDTVDVRGLFVRTKETREAYCAENGFPAADSYEALLNDDALDAILLMTPPNARVELVEAAAAAGKHILMEKPVERTTKAARHMVDVCDKAGVKLGIIFQHRFRKSSIAAKKMLTDGSLGKMRSMYLVVPWWRGPDYYKEPGRGTIERDGGGVLMTQAVHSLDLMLSLTGPVAEAQAIVGTALHDMESEDFVGAGVRFENGAIGSIMATVNTFPGAQEYMVFDCDNGSMRLAGGVLEINWRDGRVETLGEDVKTGGGTDPMDFPFEWHQAQIEDFVDAVQNDRSPQSTGHTALHTHRLIDALLASSAEGRLIKVASV